MSIHDLSRGARLALTILLTAAILLPLLLLAPLYIEREAADGARSATEGDIITAP